MRFRLFPVDASSPPALVKGSPLPVDSVLTQMYKNAEWLEKRPSGDAASLEGGNGFDAMFEAFLAQAQGAIPAFGAACAAWRDAPGAQHPVLAACFAIAGPGDCYSQLEISLLCMCCQLLPVVARWPRV